MPTGIWPSINNIDEDFMNDIRKAVLASLTAAGLSTVALPATAIEITPVMAVELDDVLIDANGFDLGGPGFSNGVPTSPAHVEWHQAWFGSTHKFNGTIHFDDQSGDCARVQLISYDDDSVEIPPRNYSPVECVYEDGHIERPVSVQGNVGAAEVKVRLQTQAVNGSWGGIGSQVVTYGPVLGTSEVSISRAEFDLGSGDFVGGTAASPATVTWSVSGSGIITPTVSGTLYMKNADDLCGRMRYKYINNSAGMGVLEERTGTENCVTNDDLYTFDVQTGNYSNSAVDEVKIIIEKKSQGVWSVVGSTTATLPKVPVLDLSSQTLP